MSSTAEERRRRSPYQGLTPYEEADWPYFFGREVERDVIISNLLSSRLTLLYGPSGVGKSSVLRAGVARELRRLAEVRRLPPLSPSEAGSPEFVVIVFDGWKGDPIQGLLKEIQAALEEALGRPVPEPSTPGFVPAVEAWARDSGVELLLILDQFEEYFLYHPHEGGEGTFAEELPRALGYGSERHGRWPGEGNPLRIRFLLSFREDALAKLDFFKGRIPILFDNYLRLDALTPDKAGDAIVKPVEVFNSQEPPPDRRVEVGEGLVEAVLEEVRPEKVRWGVTGRGSLDQPTAASDEKEASDEKKTSDEKAGIETPYLQLVLMRLWEREMELGSAELRKATLTEDLGGAGQIVRAHLNGALKELSEEEQDLAARLFHYLVTPSGTKIALSPSTLAFWGGSPEADVAGVLQKLERQERRILRRVPASEPGEDDRYEIYHDKLAPAVLSWRNQHIQQRELERQRQQQQQQQDSEARRRWRLALAVSVTSLVVLVLASFALKKEAQQKITQIKERAARDSVEQVVSSIRDFYRGTATAIDPNDRYIVTISEPGGRLRVLDLHTGQSPPLPLQTQERMTAAAFDPTAGRILAAGGAGGTIYVWIFPELELIATLVAPKSRVNAIAFSPDGQRLVAASDDGTVRVWSVPDSSLIEVQRFDRPVRVVSVRPTPQGASVEAVSPEDRQAMRCQRIIFVSGDGTLEEAAWEARRLSGMGGHPTIYWSYRDLRGRKRPYPYRTTVGPFCSQAEADSALAVLRRVWSDAYVSHMPWACPRPVLSRESQPDFGGAYVVCR